MSIVKMSLGYLRISDSVALYRWTEALTGFQREHRDDPKTLLLGVTSWYEQFKKDLNSDGVAADTDLRSRMVTLEGLIEYVRMFADESVVGKKTPDHFPF